MTNHEGGETVAAGVSNYVEPRNDQTRPQRPSLWKRGWFITSAVIGVVGAVTGVIQIYQSLARDTTTFAHLTATAEPVAENVQEWAIPLDALSLGLPNTSGACNADQLHWLEENAQPLNRSFAVSVRNNATEGAMLALTDFRADATAAVRRGPVFIRLVCDPSGAIPERVTYSRIEADDPESTGKNVVAQKSVAAAPEVATSFNLAPGESGRLTFEIFSRMPAAGELSFTALSGRDSVDVELEGSTFDVPSLLYSGDMVLRTTPEGLVCQHVAGNTIVDCTVQYAIDELALANAGQ